MVKLLLVVATYIVAYVHIAHDCVVGNHNVFSNNTSLAGHAKIGSNVTCGGFVKIAQHCQIGDSAFIAGDAAIVKDVPAFICVAASPARPAGLNRVGLSRSNTPTESQKGSATSVSINLPEKFDF